MILNLDNLDFATKAELIASAKVEDDRLIITDLNGSKITIQFSQHPALARIPESERSNFTLSDSDDLFYLRWKSLDIHIDLDSIRTELDPKLKAEKLEVTRRFNLSYGGAIVRTLKQRNISSVEGISKERIESIGQGQFPDSTELKALADAHRMGINDYLNLLSNEL